MRYYHNVFCGTLNQTSLNEIQAESMHLIEFLCLEQFAIIYYLPKVVHALSIQNTRQMEKSKTTKCS